MENSPLTYDDFLRAKVLSTPDMGITVEESEINPILKPHQRAIVRWACKRGRAAIALGLKLYETRGWRLRPEEIGVPIAIHASKKAFREKDYPWEYFKECRDRLAAAGLPLWRLDYGKVICIVDFVACLPTHAVRSTLGTAEFWGDFSDFDDGGRPRYAFKIANLRVIPEAHRPEITGRQGFFDVPNEIGLWSL